MKTWVRIYLMTVLVKGFCHSALTAVSNHQVSIILMTHGLNKLKHVLNKNTIQKDSDSDHFM